MRAGSIGTENALIHGHGRRGKRTPTYKSWKRMRARCHNENCDKYQYYGGRGISICSRWDSFENFLEDMGERPEGASLDRIDVDGDYEPGNCRWATVTQQMRNRSNTVWIDYRGEKYTIGDLADMAGLPYWKVKQRLKRGWSVERAIS